MHRNRLGVWCITWPVWASALKLSMVCPLVHWPIVPTSYIICMTWYEICSELFFNSSIDIFQVEKDFAFGLYELDWDVFGVHIEGACNRVPCLEKIGIKSTVCGPESFTPDHKPILGEDPRVRGFFHGCGFNSGGMMFGEIFFFFKIILI